MDMFAFSLAMVAVGAGLLLVPIIYWTVKKYHQGVG